MKDNKWKQFLTEGKKLSEAAILKRNHIHKGKTLPFANNELTFAKSFQRSFIEGVTKLLAQWKWKSDDNKKYVLDLTKETYEGEKNKVVYVSMCASFTAEYGWIADKERNAVSQPFEGKEDLRLLKAFLTELKIGQ